VVIVCFARISDGSEINDDDILQRIYQNHLEFNKSNELELVALEKDEEFCEYSLFSKLSITSTIRRNPTQRSMLVKIWHRYDV
jgi:hypothetical protein